ncbi:hypothetical protein [Catellatospora tritici]|uniref:hypothetical protein n=1 Tax=Catellatospora tritici TaxID=2851566 RepID=UPI001C2DB128|nr:hypothetical protein [Catellatospora tritici]MBV1852437.1 hypothetical protein [Catellatospora tritici]
MTTSGAAADRTEIGSAPVGLRVCRMALRLAEVDWEESQLTVPSRMRLMREFLRRSALWAQRLGAVERWPFFDIAGVLEPDLKIDPELVHELVQEMDRRGVIWPNHLVVPYVLAFVALSSPPTDLPDPFEPLLRFWERGGSFSREGGAILIGHTQRVSAVEIDPYLTPGLTFDISEAVLDELDAPWRAKIEARSARAKNR